jgi:SAM-dependent methyltransferase
LSIEQWNERYRAGEQVFNEPAPLVTRFSAEIAPGDALDLACGPGRNALFLAQQGWRVTAVDGSLLAIDFLRERARERKLAIDARVADLERGEFQIQPGAWDLICDCYYLQRSLLPQIKAGLRPGGIAIVIVHLADADQPQGTPTRARPGELRAYFTDWKILHSYEGESREACHKRPVAELVAQKPLVFV